MGGTWLQCPPQLGCSGFHLPPVAHASKRHPTAQDPLSRERCSYGGPTPCPRPPPALSQLWGLAPQPPQVVSTQPTLVLYLELSSEACISAPRPCPSISAVVSWVMVALSLLALLSPAAVLLYEALSSPSFPADLPVNQLASQGMHSFPLSQLPLRSAGPILIPFLFFSFFNPVMWSFLPFLEV